MQTVPIDDIMIECEEHMLCVLRGHAAQQRMMLRL